MFSILSENRNTQLPLVILLSRFVSELLTTFVWDKANYIWSVLFLCAVPLIIWPFLALNARRHSNIFTEYLPIMLFLFFLLIRTKFSSLYSLKCFLSELIVWFCFIFTIEIFKRDEYSALKLRQYLIYLAKFAIIVGAFQLIAYFFTTGFNGLVSALDARPVYGIFDHPNTYLICIIPFSLYFFKKRAYAWLFLALTTCLFTGTRSPFLAILCMLFLFLKSALNKPLNKTDIIFSFLIIIIVLPLYSGGFPTGRIF